MHPTVDEHDEQVIVALYLTVQGVIAELVCVCLCVCA